MTRVSKKLKGEVEGPSVVVGGVSGVDECGLSLVAKSKAAEEGSSKGVGWTKFLDDNGTKGGDGSV